MYEAYICPPAPCLIPPKVEEPPSFLCGIVSIAGLLLGMGFFAAVIAYAGFIEQLLGGIVLGETHPEFDLAEKPRYQMGAIGGAILAFPSIGLEYFAGYIITVVKRKCSWGWWFLSYITLLPVVHVGFGAMRGLVGWAILNGRGNLDFEAAKIVAISSVGSTFTLLVILVVTSCLLCSKK